MIYYSKDFDTEFGCVIKTIEDEFNSVFSKKYNTNIQLCKILIVKKYSTYLKGTTRYLNIDNFIEFNKSTPTIIKLKVLQLL